MISGHTSTRKKETVKKVLLLNVIGTALPEVTDGNCRRTKAPSRHKKHGGTMALITELKRGINYGRSGNKETQGKVSRTKQKS